MTLFARTDSLLGLAACLLVQLTAVSLTSCSDDGGDSTPTDAGRDGGFILSDRNVDQESIGFDPTSVEFEDVEVGETDLHGVDVINQSTQPLRLTDIIIVQSDNTVTFANLFVGDMSDTHGWRDLNGDRQSFESKDGPITVIPGGSFEVIIQFRPDGSLLDCLDRPPAPCGFLRVTGEETSADLELFVPRGD